MSIARVAGLGLLVVSFGLVGCADDEASGAQGAASAESSATAPAAPAAADEPCPGESPSPTSAGDAEAVPENPNHAGNRAFLKTVDLTGKARCQGLAAVERTAAELSRLGADGGPYSPEQVSRMLAGLGYDPDGTVVNGGDGRVSFTATVAAGVCLEGDARPGDPAKGVRPVVDVEAHGPYLEGGCDRPQPGH